MIKFFRHIRQSLLMEKPTSAQPGKSIKYLKYALGEIILVVIGILIALQVNTWNENRKNISKKNALLKAMKVEFKDNLEQLDTVIYYDNLVLKSCGRLLGLTEEQISTIPVDTLI